jgi:RsiW-degrading membrane proteinase PrsW (M82 family)
MKRLECVIPIHKPRLGEYLFFLLSGAITSIPLTLFINIGGDYLLAGVSAADASLLSLVLFAPFIEEFAKAFPLFYRHGETQRSIVNLALCAGLGFAIVEFLEYIFLLGVSPIVRLPGLVFHSASTSITAYGIATKKPLPYYLLAVLLHASNNFLAVVDPFVPSVIILAITVFIAWSLYRKTKERFINPTPCETHENPTPQPNAA